MIHQNIHNLNDKIDDNSLSEQYVNRRDSFPSLIQKDMIPQELYEYDQWVLWRSVKRNGKTTKLPYQCDGNLARINEPATWNNITTVLNKYSEGNYDGIGFVLTQNDPFVGIDLDHCYDLDSAKFDEFALNTINLMNSYTEYSPSRTGIHIIIKGILPIGRNRTKGIELYDHARYLTFTGWHVEGSSISIENRENEVITLYDKLFSQISDPITKQIAETLTDEEIITKIKASRNGDKFEKLFSGDISDYESPSEADFALCSILSFWTQSHTQIDRLLRKSKLYREKWERDDYRKRTIENALSMTPSHHEPSKEQKETSTKETISELIEDFEPFHSPRGDLFVDLWNNDHRETYNVESKEIYSIINFRYYKNHKRPLNKQALQETVDLIKAQAQFDGQKRDVYRRVARVNNTIYIDIGDETWDVIKITSSGWEVVKSDDIGIRFVRSKSMKPFPKPVRGGNIAQLHKFLNLTKESDFILFCGWILETYNTGRPKPILNIQGEQGCGKSTFSQLIQCLLDPVDSKGIAIPRNERDFIISVSNRWLSVFDNVSYLSQDISDSLCRMATGGGFTTRKLYTDNEEMEFQGYRPLALNGIVNYAQQPDLVDRMVFLFLPTIRSSQRSEEEEFWKHFHQEYAQILGAIYDGLAEALKNEPYVKIENKPRMADFARFATAGEIAMGFSTGSFLEAYHNNRRNAVIKGLEEDPIAIALIKFMANLNEWEGTLQELLSELNTKISIETQRSKYWPKAPNILSNRLRRYIPSLRKICIEVIPSDGTEHDSSSKVSRRIWRIKKLDREQEKPMVHQNGEKRKQTTNLSTTDLTVVRKTVSDEREEFVL